jgi:ABC-type multidrug transport system fused ATPase/permease subunit
VSALVAQAKSRSLHRRPASHAGLGRSPRGSFPAQLHCSFLAIFRRLLGFLAPYRRGVILSALLAAFAMGMTVVIPWLTGQAIDQIRAGDGSDLDRLGILIGVAGLGRMVLTVARRLVAGRVSLGVEQDLRQRLYAHLLSLELAFFDRQQTGQLMSRSTVDLQAVRFFLGYGLVFILQSTLTIFLAAIAMFLVDPLLAAVSLLPVPFVVLIAARYGRRARPAQQAVQQRIAELTADAEESIGGVRVVKAFAREDRQLERFATSTARVFDQEMIATKLSAFYQPLIGFLPQIGLACVLLIGGRRVVSGHMTLGDFAAFYTYLLMLLGPMRQLGMALGLAQRATASGTRLFEILDREPEIVVPADPLPLPDGNGHVELRDVEFAYAGTPAPTLHGVSLDVPAGTTVALVGATGSGKTTVVSLLGRLYDVDAGAVLIDGADVRDLDPVALRQAIAVVDDAPFLFSTTIADNIAYARGGADQVALEDIERAARRAQAHDFITALPDGYATRVGERGLTLSGGQRQRVAIARALLADPRVLILDDATSAVDASTEQQIKEALREVMAGRTTFVIAHRLSTIALADRIIVVEDGRIVAQGTHDELLEISPLYAEIVEKGLPDQVFLNRNPTEREVAGF